MPSGSSPLTGSSSSSVAGSPSSAVAIPEPLAHARARTGRRACARPRAARPGRSARRRGRSRCRASAPARAGGCRPSGRCAPSAPRAAPRPRAAAPCARGSACRSRSRCPSVGASSPRIIRIVVDLPEPFGPRKPGHDPGLHGEAELVDGALRAATSTTGVGALEWAHLPVGGAVTVQCSAHGTPAAAVLDADPGGSITVRWRAPHDASPPASAGVLPRRRGAGRRHRLRAPTVGRAAAEPAATRQFVAASSGAGARRTEEQPVGGHRVGGGVAARPHAQLHGVGQLDLEREPRAPPSVRSVAVVSAHSGAQPHDLAAGEEDGV